MGYTQHGMSHSPEYTSWENMVQRCTNPKAPNWERYGGAGVTVSEEFLQFNEFYNAIGPRPAGCTIDRIDPTLGYQRGNVRWASASAQELNKLLPHTWPGTTLDARRGTFFWRYQRAGVVTYGHGFTDRPSAFAAKVAAMEAAGVPLSRSDRTAVLALPILITQE